MFAIYKTEFQTQEFQTQERKCWTKPWLGKKHKSLCHWLVSDLLLHEKEDFRIFLRMNSKTYEVSNFVLISRCATRWRRGGGFTDPKSNQNFFFLILTLKY